MSPHISKILSWYGADNPGVLSNLARLFNHGTLSGRGRLVILPVDQGFEHGPARSFAMNPPAYDPNYHVRLAIEAGCSAYAAPLGAIELCAREFAGEIPLILKINNSDVLFGSKAPISALTSSVDDALRLGCTAIGFTIYPGSSERKQMYEEIQQAASYAKRMGLVVIIWSYPRGEQLSKDGETAIDVVAYASHIAAQLGAHIIKVKPPSAHVEQPEAKKVYESQKISIGSLKDRIHHVVASTFGGKRVVIFSGGATKDTDSLLAEVREIAMGGGFGSIMGRNAFQRPHGDALKLLRSVIEIFARQE